MKSTVCTLFEGDYHFGVGALINSLCRYGYQGSVEVGYRGHLPSWMENSDSMLAGKSIKLGLHRLTTEWHLTNYKPHFLLELFAADPTLDRIFYFDPDIVIRCEWEFFEYWVEPGVALVEEVATQGMAYNHPIRRKWVEIAGSLGISVKPSFSQYFSGGFIGVRRSMIPYLRDWVRIMDHLPNLGLDLRRFMIGTLPKTNEGKTPTGRTHPFFGTDQDAMNIFAMAAEPFLSTIGPEGMDFIPGGFTMSHAVGGPKPWRKAYLLAALRGSRPSTADKAYWENAEEPIRLFTDLQVRRRRAMIRLGSLIGRFYRQ